MIEIHDKIEKSIFFLIFRNELHQSTLRKTCKEGMNACNTAFGKVKQSMILLMF
jgi:hypothetical protein